MRVTPHIPAPAVLMLALVALVVAPAIAAAQSGLPATVTLDPEAAEPGAVVEVIGIDFPGHEPITLELADETGAAELAVVTTVAGGYFRELVTLPVDVPAGAWELRASAPDGSVATHPFVVEPGADGAGASGADTAEAGLTTRRGNSGTDVMVMIIIGVMLGAIGAGGAYAWREVHSVSMQPGMAAGQDPIWSGRAAEEPAPAPELTATGEPTWRRSDEDA